MDNNKQFVDVRSPSEFEEYALPGAVNIPLFSDEERAHVGTTYTQLGKEAAVKEGLDIVGPKLNEYYEKMKEVKKQAQGKEIVVYCWRGGMRSRSFVSTMQMLGISCAQLEEGIRSYRKKVMRALEEEQQQKREYVVLTGGTGTAKTEILQRLQQENYPVVDLEGLANHRGSAFGHIGLKRKSQKQFELDLWRRLQELQGSPYVIIEGESRRIGNVNLPDFIMDGKARGIRLNVQLPVEKRISVIMETYEPTVYHNEIRDAVDRIANKLPAEIKEDVYSCLREYNYEEVIRYLLQYYYDPRYEKAFEQYDREAVKIDSASTEENYVKVKQYVINHLEETGLPVM
ncbi:tRNA 2-selenouridine(34) synthase MnmH [Salibacterium aidingense]|uniref:tRNA 2-selenouridine(34) synthase MnmH n=1 Tax=Salibacterium aidingense TaxID=384933 RepID=UPI003BEC4E4F